jgi:hypothetical protein
MQMKVFLISFPRSGHHVLANVIKHYASITSIPFSYCEFYTCNSKNVDTLMCPPLGCTQSNCGECDVLLTKNHDFFLNPACVEADWKHEIPIDPIKTYIVMYRKDPVRQFEAWYRHYQICNTDEPNLASFRDFYLVNQEYHTAFVKKWIETKHTNVHLVSYEELVEDPENVIETVLQVLYPYKRVYSNVIKHVVKTNGICYKHNVPDNVYHRLCVCMSKPPPENNQDPSSKDYQHK